MNKAMRAYQEAKAILEDRAKHWSEFDWGYLAALLDGEGYFGVTLVHPTPQAPYYRPRISVTNTSRELATWPGALTGLGSIRHQSSRNPEWQDVWVWAVGTQQARALAELIGGRLKAKSKQAALVAELGYWAEQSANGTSNNHRDQKQAIYQELQNLHRPEND